MKLNKKGFIKWFVIVMAVVLCITSIFIFKDRFHEVRHSFARANEIKRFIIGYGSYSALIFVLIYSLRPVLMIVPASVFSIMAGNVFGPIYGLALSMAGCFFSATLAYCLANRLGKSFVDKHLKGKALELDSQIGQHGFKIMLLMRLSIIFPYDALSYAAGLSKMRYGDFIAGTLLGILPEMICYSFIGKSFEGKFQIGYLIPVAAVIIIAIAASRYYKAVKDN